MYTKKHKKKVCVFSCRALFVTRFSLLTSLLPLYFLILFILDVRDIFSEYGKINNIRVNLDTLTGFCKGYALIEYTQKSEAQDAINALHGKEFLGKTIRVNWAFVGGGSVSIDDRSGESPNKKMKCGRR